MDLQEQFVNIVEDGLRRWLPAEAPYFAQTRAFALGRLEEGRQLAEFFLGRGIQGRVLDLGAGNGGASLGMANRTEYEVVALDIVPNADLRLLQREAALPLRPVVGSGHHLPFRTDSFDVVLCLDTIEHVPDTRALGREIMRVLKPGGICMLTTPPRLRYWFRRDPHFGIQSLLMLPEPLQHWLGRALVREQYDVIHIFWHVREISRRFPEASVEVLWNRTYDPPRTTLIDRLWFRSRYFLWDRILLRKKTEGRKPDPRSTDNESVFHGESQSQKSAGVSDSAVSRLACLRHRLQGGVAGTADSC